MRAAPSDTARRWSVILSPVGVIALCSGVQHLGGRGLGAWSWIPTMIVFWAVIAGLIIWGRGGSSIKSWIGRPHGGRAWSVLAVAMGLVSVREFISGWRVLESPAVFLLWLGFGLANPWFEEAYWRGLLVDAMGDLKGVGVIYSTIAFAVSHPLIWGVHSPALRHPVALTGLALAGGVWGVAYWRTGSLRWTIVGHCSANLLGLSVPVLLNLHVPAGLR